MVVDGAAMVSGETNNINPKSNINENATLAAR
jgi:hypothetical protein